MSASLSRYLKDFGAPAPVSPPPGFAEVIVEEPPAAAFDDFPIPVAVDVEAERREAYSEGYDAATQALTEAHREEIERLAAAHADELKALREKYELEVSVVLPQRLREISSDIAEAVSVATADAIAPVLESAVAEKAILALADLIREMILDGADGPIVVRGPSTLFEALKSRFELDETPLRHVEAEDLDLSVEIDDSVLVTRMSAWAASLKGVLE